MQGPPGVAGGREGRQRQTGRELDPPPLGRRTRRPLVERPSTVAVVLKRPKTQRLSAAVAGLQRERLSGPPFNPLEQKQVFEAVAFLHTAVEDPRRLAAG